jgi:hypothetical protein
MKTLYDLLGARAGDDANELKNAFRKAVKENHPDLHPDDLEAVVRFNGIVRAYAILRDPRERAAYDGALAYERELFHRKPKRSVLGTLHNVFSEAVAVAVLAVALGGGYGLLANVLGSYEVKVAGRTAHEPTKIASVEPAPTSVTEREEPDDNSTGVVLPSIAMAASPAATAAEGSDAPEIADHVPAPSRPERETAREPTKIATFQPAGPTSARDDPADVVRPIMGVATSAVATTAKDDDAPGITNDMPAPTLPERLTAHEPAKIATVQAAAPASLAEREEPDDDPAGVMLPSIASAPSAAAITAKGSDALRIADDMPTASLPEREVANGTADPSVRTDQADSRTFTNQFVARREGEPDQGQTLNSAPNTAPSVRVELSPLEDDKKISKSFSPDLVISGQKRSPGIPDTKFLDAKTPKLRAHQKPTVAAMRPSQVHAAIKQASLENRNTSACYESQSCSSKSSPLLGVGF